MIEQKIKPRVDWSALAVACLAHMEQEEAMLSATLDSLRQVRGALLGGNLAALEQAVQLQTHTARAADELRGRRAELRKYLGHALGIDPKSVTLHDAVRRMRNDDGDRLARCRERLHRMSAEIDRLNRGNAALLQHSVDFLHQFLMNITGGEPVGDRYRPSGQIERATCGSMFEGSA